MPGRWLIGCFLAAALATASPLLAQPGRPLAPLPPDGLRVAPFFDGFYQNDDGSVTFSFGYSNLNTELVEIPLGPENFITPKEFDGRQPTSFPPILPDTPAGRRDRARGVFTVTAPPGFKGDVVWTLRYLGQTYTVPARTRHSAYMLKWPMAMGSIPPLLRFAPDGPAGRGPTGIESGPVKATVGTPLAVTIWATDDSVREKDPVEVTSRRETRTGAINVTWYKHSGPGPVAFDPAKAIIAELQGTSSTSVTFTQPGEYVLRVRADNFGRLDTSAGNQCCWTNGYLRVAVTP
ncbi:MAG: hypothetical protein AB1635_18880 [Acidobacteriota bacterium]